MPEPRPVPLGSAVTLKGGLLALWALWWTVVFATNVCDAAKALGLLGETWAFASGNFGALTETTARYGPTPWMNRCSVRGSHRLRRGDRVVVLACALVRSRRGQGTAFRSTGLHGGLRPVGGFLGGRRDLRRLPTRGRAPQILHRSDGDAARRRKGELTLSGFVRANRGTETGTRLVCPGRTRT